MSEVLVRGPDSLLLSDIVRLIDIAHETKDSEVRRYALAVLKSHFEPPIPQFVINLEEPRG